MKKWKIISLILLVTFIFVGCAKEDKEYLVSISYSEFKEKRANKETFFFEFVQDGCSACMSFTPKLKEVLEENKITGYQLNLSSMTDEEYEEFQLEFKTSGTPNTIFLTEGEELSKLQRISGNVAKTKIVSKLKANGYIKDL